MKTRKPMKQTGDSLLGKVVGYVNENVKKPIYESTKEIKVQLIDWKPLLDKIKKSHPMFKRMDIDIRSGNGIIFVGKDKTPVLINTECCGVDSDKKNLVINGELVPSRFISGIGLFKKEKNIVHGTPFMYIDIDYEDIERCFTWNGVELWDFMGQRYEYNPRIHTNMRGIVKLYKNGIEKENEVSLD